MAVQDERNTDKYRAGAQYPVVEMSGEAWQVKESCVTSAAGKRAKPGAGRMLAKHQGASLTSSGTNKSSTDAVRRNATSIHCKVENNTATLKNKIFIAG